MAINKQNQINQSNNRSKSIRYVIPLNYVKANISLLNLINFLRFLISLMPQSPKDNKKLI